MLKRLTTGTVTVAVPTIAATVLALIAGALQVLNEVVFTLSPEWHGFVAVILVFLAGMGISPLVGPAFRAALHLPALASLIISSGLSAAMLAISTMQMGPLAHAVIAAGITILTALGFAPSATLIVPPTSEGRPVDNPYGVAAATAAFRCGALAPFRPPALKDFASYLIEKLTPPPVVVAPEGPYPMDNNDVEGDCTMAGVAHLMHAFNKIFGLALQTPLPEVIKQVYRKLTGGGDTGLVEWHLRARHG